MKLIRKINMEKYGKMIGLLLATVAVVSIIWLLYLKAKSPDKRIIEKEEEAYQIIIDKPPVTKAPQIAQKEMGVIFQAHFNLDYRTVDGMEPILAEGVSLTDGIVHIPSSEPVQGVLVDEDDRLEYNFPPEFNLEEGTFEFWFKPNWTSQPKYGFAFVKTRPFHGSGFGMSKDGANNYRFSMFTPAGEAGVYYGVGSQLKENKWYHMAATWTPDEICLYLNGSRVAIETTNKIRPTVPPQIFSIGHADGRDQAEGTIDEFKIYSYAKSTEEIQASMAEGLDYSALKVRPLPAIRPGESRPMTTLAYNSKFGGWIDVTSLVEWHVRKPNLLIDEEDCAFGLSPGVTQVQASLSGLISPPVTMWVTPRNKAVFIVDKSVYWDIWRTIKRYKADVENNLPFELIIDYSHNIYEMKPKELRQLLQKYYYQQGVEGVILAGHVPYALWEEKWTDWYTESRGVVSTLYYEDLDAQFFKDNPEEPVFNRVEVANSFLGPEIWVAWMYPNSISPDEDATKLKDLLNKTHAYYSKKVNFEPVAVEHSHHDPPWVIANQTLSALAPEDGSFFPEEGVEHYGLETDARGNPVPTRPLRRQLTNPPDVPIKIYRETFETIWNKRNILIYHLHCHGSPCSLWLPTESEPHQGIDRNFIDTLERGPLLFCVTACSNGVFNHKPHESDILAAPFSSANTITACGFVTGPNFSRDFAPIFESLAQGKAIGRAHYDAMMEEPLRLPIVIGDPFLRIIDLHRF